MANTYEQSLGDGSNNQFTVPFPYISKTHVHVFIDSAEDSDFTWINDGLIQTSVVPANGAVVERRRITPTGPLVNFTDGSTLGETDLDKATLQTLYLTEESADVAANVMKPDTDGAFDALNARIKNVAPAEDANDAVTKAQLDAVSVAAGNVPSPGAGVIGQFLKATAAGVWAWAQLTFSDITGILPVTQGGTGAATQAGARTGLGLGSAATQNVGTGPNNVVQLDGSSKLPAVDGSQLTNLNIPSPTGSNIALWSWFS